MPIVTVSMYSGRTQREKDRLAEAMTEDIVKIIIKAKYYIVEPHYMQDSTINQLTKFVNESY